MSHQYSIQFFRWKSRVPLRYPDHHNHFLLLIWRINHILTVMLANKLMDFTSQVLE
ncbi:hypothetical protein V6Z12_A11G223800 [Gossypium hirsutum]